MLSAARNPSLIAPNNKAEGVPESWDAYFWIEDADELFTEFKNNNALVMYEPLIRDYYDMKEFAIRDLDGYVLAFWAVIEINPPRSPLRQKTVP